jgi:hypothetical protein
MAASAVLCRYIHIATLVALRGCVCCYELGVKISASIPRHLFTAGGGITAGCATQIVIVMCAEGWVLRGLVYRSVFVSGYLRV